MIRFWVRKARLVKNESEIYEEMILKDIGTEKFLLYTRYADWVCNPVKKGYSKIEARDYPKAD